MGLVVTLSLAVSSAIMRFFLILLSVIMLNGRYAEYRDARCFALPKVS
jgi:hypothetical protein